ncbi:MAG: prepilin-type N-terminal cleavage/methylation domain-containing protein [Terracidiphilus sp.]
MNRKNLNCRARRSYEPNGFTLMELLIVMAIITVLMLIGFPTYRSVMKHSRELSAKKSMQTIQQAEMMYSTNYPSKGFACNLQYLGGDPGKPPSATASEMLPDELAKGNKDGYIFTITNCAKNALNGSERVDGYTITAVPEAVGKTGDLGFCSDEGGVLKQDPAGGVNCAELVQ